MVVKEKLLSLFIPIKPIPKAYRTYDSRVQLTRDCAKYQRDIKRFVASSTSVIADGYIWVEYIFFLERKKSHKKLKYPAVKPDYDNLIKSTQDGIEAAGVIANDSRIVSCTAKKLFADDYDKVSECGTHFILGVFNDIPETAISDQEKTARCD